MEVNNTRGCTIFGDGVDIRVIPLRKIQRDEEDFRFNGKGERQSDE